MQDTVIVVTGASAGIGAALAQLVGQKGARPVLLARREAEEVAAVIAGVIESPRADVYTRDGARQMVASYCAAEDMGAVEAQPPFVMVPR
jgi:NADP-dependent 3-hydroxy acid dehydrogenase YdfG